MAFSHLSVPVGEPGDSALDLRLEGEWHPLSGAVQAISPLQWFFPAGSRRRAVHPVCRLGSVRIDVGGTRADPCD